MGVNSSDLVLIIILYLPKLIYIFCMTGNSFQKIIFAYD